MSKAYIISDMHMMAGYSQWDTHWPIIEKATSDAKTFFIIGDLYELLNARLSFRERIEKAIGHLEKFVADHKNCTFHYMIGNHEHFQDFKDVLDDLKRRMPNLVVHDNAFRLGNAVYVHGDEVIDHHAISASRSFYPEESFVQRLYKRATLPLVDKWQHRFRTARKEYNYPGNVDLDFFLHALGKADLEFRDGVEHVFYGHTHFSKQVENYKDSGVSFHNPGAGVQEATFNMLEVEMNGDNVIGVKPAFFEQAPNLLQKSR